MLGCYVFLVIYQLLLFLELQYRKWVPKEPKENSNRWFSLIEMQCTLGLNKVSTANNPGDLKSHWGSDRVMEKTKRSFTLCVGIITLNF